MCSEAVGVGQDLDERAEVGDALDRALVDRADLGLGGEALDDVERLLHGVGIARRDVDRAVVLDVDGDAGLIDDALDGLAAGADDEADLVGLDLDGRDARRVLARARRAASASVSSILPRMCMRPSLACSSACVQDLAREAGDLDVHLDGGDAALGAADLEVHVAEVVFVAEDVARGWRLRSPSVMRPIAMPATGALIGTPASMSESAAAADRGHRRRAVRLERLGDDADRVRELVAAPGSCATSARSARAPWPISRRPGPRIGLVSPVEKRREVVVQHEALPALAGERVDLLLVGRGAERGGDDRLRLAALEERRAVHAREEADLAHDGADRLACRGRRCACPR